jgi:hypothetical protein
MKQDDFVLNPIPLLRFISKSLRRTGSTPRDSKFARLGLGLNTKSSKKVSVLPVCFGLLCLVLSPGAASADEGTDQSLSQELAAGFDATVRVLGFGVTTAPADSDRNPDNHIMNISRYGAMLHLRPDFRLDWRRLTLALKPRAELQYETWREGRDDGDAHWRDTTYIQEWLVRWQALEVLYLSYGRENLQWGPSYLTSLSNPFLIDNGRSNPKFEVAAQDFARAVWVPSVAWSVSLIANTDPGRDEMAAADFYETYALKIDYSGTADYASVIAASREDGRRQIGGYYGRTVSDALLLYAEGALLQNPAGRYPERADTPLGLAMREADHPNTWRGAVLAGGAYTLATGPTLSVEYLYYGPGYDGAEAERFFDLQENAAGALVPASAITPLAYGTLGQTADPGLRFLRRNYVMLQYIHTDIADVLDTTLRWTQNLDDGSGRLTAIIEWAIGDHVQFFGIGTLDQGSERSEFGSILDYQFMLGVEYIF